MPFHVPTLKKTAAMITVRVAVAAALGALLFAVPAYAAQCGGGGPRPDWIDRPETVTAEYFFAAGVSDSARAPLSERIATAKQNALKSLSEMIQVSVRNALVLEQSSRKTRGGEFTESNLSSVTQTSTEASPRNVEIVDTWEDPKSCDMWLRARVQGGCRERQTGRTVQDAVRLDENKS